MHQLFSPVRKRDDLTHAMSWGPSIQENRTLFRLWAPAESKVELHLAGQTYPMTAVGEGWYELALEEARHDEPYGFCLGSGRLVADPASRWQADGVNGLSRFPDPSAYRWSDGEWTGRPWEEAVIYEIHVGTFTADGTFEAAARKLSHLAEIGVTAIEIMPVAEFPGERGWGYDGVFHYAPYHGYGKPDDFKRFVDTAHGLGMMVFLDVVYNHFGPEGNYLCEYAPDFFKSGQETPWGAAIAFEQPAVRRFFIENTVYWLQEFHLDGLRFDAVDQIDDTGEPHFLQEMAEEIHGAFPDRIVHLMTENPPNGTDLQASGLFQADWNDDFHHVVHRLATGETGGNFSRYKEDAWNKLRITLAQGYYHPGKRTLSKTAPPSAALPPTAFIHYLQNHDQVGNRAIGDRLFHSVSIDLYKALTAILLLSPQIPLLFMGDHYLEPQRFHFFSDYSGEIADAIARNRPKEAEGFGGYPPGVSKMDIPDPNAPATFEASRLDWTAADRPAGKQWAAWLRNLLDIRRDRIVPLLGDTSGYAGSIQAAPEGCVFVDWQLSGHTLYLRANLSPAEVQLGEHGAEPLFSTEPATQLGRLAPFGVSVSLT